MIDAATIVGERAISFTVSGGWAHFRRVDANRTKMTYRLPPRTTVTGLCAAVLGRDRDSYYELFGEGVSAIAIGIDPTAPTRTVSMPVQSLKTAKGEGIRTINTEAGTIQLPDPSYPRQRYAYEMLVDPRYRIDVWLADEEAHQTLAERLSEGRSEYGLSLGLSECLATVRPESVTEPTIEPIDDTGDREAINDDGSGRGAPTIPVDSAVPVPIPVVGQGKTTITTERSPGWMRVKNGSRMTDGWIDWQFDPAGSSVSIRTAVEGGSTPVRLADRTVVMS